MTDDANGDAHGSKGPLDGIRVIDWTMWQFGPVSAMMLADLGAEVIKVESLDGDHGRQFGVIGGLPSDLGNGINAYYASMNRNKRGIALDLKNPKGLEVMRKLIKKSDVFIENFRKGVAERLGLGYDDVAKIRPNIVYGSGSGYGPNGPDSGKPAFALTGEARSGSLWWSGPADDTPYNINGMADQMAGIMLSYGILGAIIARERFGIGQRVDVSHLGSLMWLGGMRDGIALRAGKMMERQHRKMAGNVLWNTYKCGDGKWIAFSMSQGDRYWPAFCRALDREDLVEEIRFSTMVSRNEHREELIEILDEIFLTRPRLEWEQRLNEAGDLIWERVQDVMDLADDPQVIENNYLIDFDHPVLGPTKWHQTPVGFSETPVSTRRMAPMHGEETETILIDLLGYTWDDIEVLKDDGVIL
ncbi:MAG: CoA transferase [Chloroflexi bacterium]|nr:CoA transferase [Chloroflexota bacterium]